MSADKFDPRNCSVQLNLSLTRLKLQKAKKTESINVLKREIIGLLDKNESTRARLRVISLIHSIYYIETLSILEVYIHSINTSVDIIAAQFSCPLDLTDAIATLVFVVPFLENSPELVKVRSIFLKKWPDCKSWNVNPKVKSSVAAELPDDALVNYYISAILNEHQTPEDAPSKSEKIDESSLAELTLSPNDNSSQLEKLHQNIIQPSDKSKVIAILKLDLSNCYWAIPPNKDSAFPPIYIPNQFIQNAKDGDLVLVQKDKRSDGKSSGKVLSIYTSEKSFADISSIRPSHVRLNGSTLKPPNETDSISTKSPASSLTISSSSVTIEGEFIIDSLKHGWIQTDNDYIYVHPNSMQDSSGIPYPSGVHVSAKVFKKNSKSVAKIIRVLNTSPHKPLDNITPKGTNQSPLITPTYHVFSPSIPTTQSTTIGMTSNNIQNSGESLFVKGVLAIQGPVGYVFDEINSADPPILISLENLSGAKHGDYVEVQIDQTSLVKSSTTRFGSIFKVLTHSPQHTVEDQTSHLNKISPTSTEEKPTTKTSKSESNSDSNDPEQTLPLSLNRSRHISLLPEDVDADYILTLETNENGDGYIPHPTLPWTYILIPRNELGMSISGDEIAIDIIQEQDLTSQVLRAKLIGITRLSETDSYSIKGSFPISDSSDKSTLNNDPSTIILPLSDSPYRGEDSEAELRLLEESLSQLKESSLNIQEPLYTETETEIPQTWATPQNTLILDIGSFTIKLGYANQSVPVYIIPCFGGKIGSSLIGGRGGPTGNSLLAKLAVSSNSMSNENDIEWIVGLEAEEKKGLVNLTYPFVQGNIVNLELFSQVLCSSFSSLTSRFTSNTKNTLPNISKNDNIRFPNIIVLDHGLMSPELKFKISQILFEKVFIKNIAFSPAPLCALLCEKRNTGLVLDIGHTSTTITPILNGEILDYAISTFPISGLHISERLIHLLQEDGNRFFSSESHRRVAHDMKENYAYVARDPREERRKLHRLNSSNPILAKPHSFILPDGNTVSISRENCFECCEILFDPQIIGLNCEGLPAKIESVLLKCGDKHLISKLLSQILIIGGTSALPGLKQRLVDEISQRFKGEIIEIVQPLKAIYSSWIGTSILLEEQVHQNSHELQWISQK